MNSAFELVFQDLIWVEVSFSVFEIFDEQVIDLLAEKIKPLKVYECPKNGFYSKCNACMVANGIFEQYYQKSWLICQMIVL